MIDDLSLSRPVSVVFQRVCAFGQCPVLTLYFSYFTVTLHSVIL